MIFFDYDSGKEFDIYEYYDFEPPLSSKYFNFIDGNFYKKIYYNFEYDYSFIFNIRKDIFNNILSYLDLSFQLKLKYIEEIYMEEFYSYKFEFPNEKKLYNYYKESHFFDKYFNNNFLSKKKNKLNLKFY